MGADSGAAQRVAEAARDAMYARDRAARALGITVQEVGPGFASCKMTVREDMLNGHGTCHGGLIFTLADTAFAYACNSYDRATVALAAQITFTAPVRGGDELIAMASERTRKGRTGVYDVEVARADGTVVALFRGNAYETRGTVVPAGVAEAEASRDARTTP
jgi:acyl-CoA thioesterase